MTVLTVSGVADLFHVSTKTIVRWANEGKLPNSLTLGGHRRFDPEVIARIAASRRFEVGAPPERAVTTATWHDDLIDQSAREKGADRTTRITVAAWETDAPGVVVTESTGQPKHFVLTHEGSGCKFGHYCYTTLAGAKEAAAGLAGLADWTVPWQVLAERTEAEPKFPLAVRKALLAGVGCHES